MLHIPKKRNCPSLSRSTCMNIRRQPAGDRNGNMPSITRTRARASQNESLSNFYFLPWVGVAAGVELPRKTLKNSEDDGSTTSRSLFLPKLAL
jgi:hypothetical protein